MEQTLFDRKFSEILVEKYTQIIIEDIKTKLYQASKLYHYNVFVALIRPATQHCLSKAGNIVNNWCIQVSTEFQNTEFYAMTNIIAISIQNRIIDSSGTFSSIQSNLISIAHKNLEKYFVGRDTFDYDSAKKLCGWLNDSILN